MLNGKEELERHRSDRMTNNQKVAVLREDEDQFVSTTWADIKVCRRPRKAAGGRLVADPSGKRRDRCSGRERTAVR